MTKKRLYKSSDAIVSGVCGGIAEYFGIDPTLVRILAVVLVIAGLGFPIILYVVCMVVFPPDPATTQGYVDAQAQVAEPPCQKWQAYCASAVCSSDDPANQPPPPDPTTRVPVGNAHAAVSASAPAAGVENGTATAGNSAATADNGAVSGTHTSSFATSPKNRWSTVPVIGALLIGIGIMALLTNFIHISLWRFWPAVLIVVGLVSLFTPGPKGWSLERAGGAIVLVSIGLVLLAWMLQIIHTGVLIMAFFNLWPAFLIVAGLAIIGSARKSSVITLLSSLVLSVTILFGVWLYSGIDLWHLNAPVLFSENSGLHEFITEAVFWN